MKIHEGRRKGFRGDIHPYILRYTFKHMEKDMHFKRLIKEGERSMAKERKVHDYEETPEEKAYWEGYNDGYNQSTKDNFRCTVYEQKKGIVKSWKELYKEFWEKRERSYINKIAD